MRNKRRDKKSIPPASGTHYAHARRSSTWCRQQPCRSPWGQLCHSEGAAPSGKWGTHCVQQYHQLSLNSHQTWRSLRALAWCVTPSISYPFWQKGILTGRWWRRSWVPWKEVISSESRLEDRFALFLLYT